MLPALETHMSVAALLLLACSKPPVIDLVDPASGAAGTPIQILGSEFTPDTTATLGGQPVSDLAVRGVVALSGTVPEGLEAGPHDLVVTAAAGTATLAGAFAVQVQSQADAGVPCAGDFTAFSQLSMAREVMVIDKHFKKRDGEEEGKRDTVRLSFRDIARIEYQEAKVTEEGEERICSAIWVVTKSGDRHLFDDDTSENLQPRANEIAVGLQKPIEVTRAE